MRPRLARGAVALALVSVLTALTGSRAAAGPIDPYTADGSDGQGDYRVVGDYSLLNQQARAMVSYADLESVRWTTRENDTVAGLYDAGKPVNYLTTTFVLYDRPGSGAEVSLNAALAIPPATTTPAKPGTTTRTSTVWRYGVIERAGQPVRLIAPTTAKSGFGPGACKQQATWSATGNGSTTIALTTPLACFSGLMNSVKASGGMVQPAATVGVFARTKVPIARAGKKYMTKWSLVAADALDEVDSTFAVTPQGP